MGNFTDFRNHVKAVFSFMPEKDLYFSQLRDGYVAAYKPAYPESTDQDVRISEISDSGAYLRGNYELVHVHNGKAHSHYAEHLSQLQPHCLEIIRTKGH